MDTMDDTRLTIDGKEARDLATRLAALTGVDVSEAVIKVLRVEVERLKRERDVEAEVARMMAAAREIRAHLKGPGTSDTSDFYDEDGFPA